MSTAGVMRAGPLVTRGTALYMKLAPPAWKSSFLYNVTPTATLNFDEAGVWRQALLFFVPLKMTSVIDVRRCSLRSRCLSSEQSGEPKHLKRHWTLC